MDVGDVLWVELPSGGGHAQSGRRPAVVVQDARATDKLPTLLVVPLTTQLEALRFPGTVLVEPSAENGLRRPSVALVFQLTAIDRRFIGSSLGRISAAVLEEIWNAFDGLTGR